MNQQYIKRKHNEVYIKKSQIEVVEYTHEPVEHCVKIKTITGELFIFCYDTEEEAIAVINEITKEFLIQEI